MIGHREWWLGVVPLLAVVLAVRAVMLPMPAGAAAAGFGLLALTGGLHLLADRRPGRWALKGAAWVATIVLVTVMVVLLTPWSGD